MPAQDTAEAVADAAVPWRAFDTTSRPTDVEFPIRRFDRPGPDSLDPPNGRETGGRA